MITLLIENITLSIEKISHKLFQDNFINLYNDNPINRKILLCPL